MKRTFPLFSENTCTISVPTPLGSFPQHRSNPEPAPEPTLVSGTGLCASPWGRWPCLRHSVTGVPLHRLPAGLGRRWPLLSDPSQKPSPKFPARRAPQAPGTPLAALGDTCSTISQPETPANCPLPSLFSAQRHPFLLGRWSSDTPGLGWLLTPDS